jgi:hypothetical protein
MVQSKQPPIDLSLNAAHVSLTDHVTMKGREIFEKYGPKIGWSELQAILADKECVRYPVEIVFDSSKLENDEIAYPEAKGDIPEDGFTLYIHPYFSLDTTRVPSIALYQLVLVNYGAFAAHADAEAFGAACLGLDVETYYVQLCEIADEISTSHLMSEPVMPETSHSGCSGGGSCGCKH